MRTIVLSALAALSLSGPLAAQDAGRVPVGGIDIAYRVIGPDSAPPLLVIQSVGGVMPTEPDALSEALSEAGFRVILYDNRDAGGSTRFDAAGLPDFAAIQQAMMTGAPPPVAYALDDLAGDAVGLMDALGIERAHVVGGSLGGLVAQIVAADHPDRVASLTLVSTSTGNPELPQAAPPAEMEEMDPGTARQAAAAAIAGDLRPRSATIGAPTVVIHGERDELFAPAHGRDVAATIPGAELIVMPGMGHVPAEADYPAIVRAIRSVAARARAN